MGLLDPRALGLTPIARLGPSRFAAFRGCALREAYRAARVNPLLPPAPASYLGSAIHRFLAFAAVRSHTALTEASARRALDQFIAEQESRVDEPFAAHLLPLSSSVADYQVRCQRAVAAAVRLSGIARPAQTVAPARSSSSPRLFGPEVWVASSDGLLGGYVDEITKEEDGVVLRDYKTGLAAVPGSPEADEAWLQLYLYAALFAESAGVWPVRLELVPLEGEPSSQTPDHPRCTALVAEAKSLLARTNSLIASRKRAADAGQALASPAGPTCGHCAYRPLCSAYIASDHADREWPNDLVGIVAARHPLRNGRLLFELRDVQGKSVIVRGITNDADRHPAIELVQPGARGGFFSVAGDRAGGTLTETARTTLVAYAA